MRWPRESAIARLNEQLATTRRLSVRIAGGTTAASLPLAAALGFALPGHAADSAASRLASQAPGRFRARRGTATDRRGATTTAVSRRSAVNPIACDGHGICAQMLPELIGLDEWGYPVLAEHEVPHHLKPLARRAVRLCPTLALRLEAASAQRPARVRRKRTLAGPPGAG